MSSPQFTVKTWVKGASLRLGSQRWQGEVPTLIRLVEVRPVQWTLGARDFQEHRGRTGIPLQLVAPLAQLGVAQLQWKRAPSPTAWLKGTLSRLEAPLAQLGVVLTRQRLAPSPDVKWMKEDHGR